jgi:hypothetical protein
MLTGGMSTHGWSGFDPDLRHAGRQDVTAPKLRLSRGRPSGVLPFCALHDGQPWDSRN